MKIISFLAHDQYIGSCEAVASVGGASPLMGGVFVSVDESSKTMSSGLGGCGRKSSPGHI